jgi:AraC family ethanolamine operon transcriptional activator
MHSQATHNVVFRRQFTLFEELAEASRGFDTDFRQLGPAQDRFLLEQLSTPDILFTRVRLTSHFHQVGSCPPGYRTFSLLASGSRGFRWCGEAVNSDGIVVMPEGGDFESVSPPGFDLFNVSFSHSLLARVARRHFGCDLSDILGPNRLLSSHGGYRVALLRASLHRLSGQIAASDPGTPLGESPQSLALLALSCLRGGDIRPPRSGRSKRLQTLQHALEIIARSDPGTLPVEALVSRSGVSRRTLEHAFRDGLGTSPAAYLKARRLLSFNRDLLRAAVEHTSVAALVERHGFRHPGQLAADYRALFGERPSDTLRRQPVIRP